jgi:zinc protease
MIFLWSAFLSMSFAMEPLPVDHRATPPSVVPPVAIALPAFETATLSTGASLFFLRQTGLQKATVTVRLLRGQLDLDGKRTALGSFHSTLMSKGTRGYTSEAIDLLTDLHDIELTAYHGYRQSVVGVSVPNADLDVGIGVLTEVLTEPIFPRREIKLRRQEMMRYLDTSGPASPKQVADAALRFAWFSGESVHGARPDRDGIAEVRRRSLKSHHQALLAEAPAEFLVIGELSLEAAKDWVEPLAVQLKGDGVSKPLPKGDLPTTRRIIAIDKPSAQQTILRFRRSGPLRDDPNQAAVELANWVLGGHFMARLNRNLREEKGLTYSVYSRLVSELDRGHITVKLDVAKENSLLAVREILSEFKQMVETGISAQELQDAKVSTLAEWNTALQSSGSTSSFYAGLLEREWRLKDARSRLDSAQGLTVSEVNAAAKRWFATGDPWVLVMVGPKTDIEKQVADSDFEIEWVQAGDAIDGSI